MTLDSFFEKFELFADAPGAVTKIRELVLQLAAHGKLVEQSDADEPASALVTQIESHFEELRYRRELRSSPVGPLNRETLPAIPSSWEWVCLGNVVDYGSSDKADSADIPEDAWLLDLKDVEKDTSRLVQRKSFQDSPSKSTKTAFKVGDVLYGKLRPYLNKVIVADAPGYCTTEIVPIRAFGLIDPAYICHALKRPEFIAYANSKSYGMNLPRLGTEDARNAPFPLPPLAEQKRIVAKVDELMALCDRLEALQQERETRHAVLSRASLDRFSDAPTAANLHHVFHSSYSVQSVDLRKTILALAVMGKLVPQDSHDESAFDLLGRLSQETFKEGLRLQVAPLPPLEEKSMQYEIPDSWTWARFREVAVIASNLVDPKDFLDFTHLAPDNIEKGNGVLLRCATVREDRVFSSKHRFYPGQIVYSKIRPNLAKVVVVDFEGLCSADMYPIDPLIDAYFLQRVMLSESFLVQTIKTDTRIAMPKINQVELNAIAIPVPPLAEQRRIVARVDQLMSLVDQLEAQISTARSAAADLLEAVVAELITIPLHFNQSPRKGATETRKSTAAGNKALSVVGNIHPEPAKRRYA